MAEDEKKQPEASEPETNVPSDTQKPDMPAEPEDDFDDIDEAPDTEEAPEAVQPAALPYTKQIAQRRLPPGTRLQGMPPPPPPLAPGMPPMPMAPGPMPPGRAPVKKRATKQATPAAEALSRKKMHDVPSTVPEADKYASSELVDYKRMQPATELTDGAEEKEEADSIKSGLSIALIAGVTLFVVVAVIAGFRLAKNVDQDASENAIAADAPNELLLPDVLTAENFPMAYVAMHGGETKLESVQTLIISGTIDLKEEAYNAIVRKRRPSSMYLKLLREDGSFTFGVTPEDAWLKVESKDGRFREISAIEGEDANTMRSNSHFFHQLVEHCTSGYGSILSLVEVAGVDKDLIEIEFQDPSYEKPILVTLDARTFDILTSRTILNDGNALLNTYGDFRSVNGLRMPYFSETYINGELVNRFVVDKMRMNPGLMSTNFERPKES